MPLEAHLCLGQVIELDSLTRFLSLENLRTLV